MKIAKPVVFLYTMFMLQGLVCSGAQELEERRKHREHAERVIGYPSFA